jgi:hypothetical protein
MLYENMRNQNSRTKSFKVRDFDVIRLIQVRGRLGPGKSEISIVHQLLLRSALGIAN